MIHTSGINRALALLDNDLGIIAVGTGTAPSASATQLTNTLLRKTITTSVIDGNTLIKEIFLDETEANATLTELGLLGNGANTSANSGSLFASGTAAITKDATQSLTISFEIEIKEVV